MTNALLRSGAVRRVPLHRRVALIAPGRVDIKPARSALLGPLLFFSLGAAAFAAIALGLAYLPLWLLAVLLIVAVVTLPLGGIGAVYALIGAHVIVDQQKGSLTMQQGVIGLGIGTDELVPFAKIAAVVVEEAGSAEAGEGRRVEEFAQWQIVVEKVSGKRLTLGGATAARSLGAEARQRVTEVAEAIAALSGAPLRLPAPPAPAPVAASVSSQPSRPRQRARSHGRRAKRSR